MTKSMKYVALGSISVLLTMVVICVPPHLLRHVLAQSVKHQDVKVTSSDSIELKVISGFGPWQPYWIKIYGDGRVLRDTTAFIKYSNQPGGYTYGCPLEDKDKETHIPQAAAVGLFERFINDGFYTLDAFYQLPENVVVLDSASSKLTLTLGPDTKAVAVSSVRGPDVYRELRKAVDDLSPMDNLADIGKYTPQRKAECEAFGQQVQHWQDGGRKGESPSTLPKAR